MKITLTKKEFEGILSNYDIGKYKSHKYIFTGGNTVYLLGTSKGKFILKIYGESRKNKFINFQISLMEFLSKTKVTTPKIVNTNEGEGLLIWNKHRIAIQEFSEGKGVQYPDRSLAKDMGKKWGILDKTLSGFKERSDEGEEGNQFKLVKWHNPFLFGRDMNVESKKLLKDINVLNKSELKKGLIHGDFCEGNFLVKDNKVSAIIDFDDAQENYLVQEVAVTIGQNFTTRKKVNKDLVKIFLREYQKFIKLNPEEKKALFYFIKWRLLDSASWCYNQIKEHPKRKKELLGWTKEVIDKYFIFSKVTPEEWMGWLR